LDADALAELARLAGDGSARLYVTACDLDCVSGIAEPDYELPLQIGFGDGEVRLTLKDGRGEMRLPVPPQATHFAADSAPLAEAMPVALYSETRLGGVIAATGIFADAEGAEARLVLAGRGNQCWAAGGISHWLLDVAGPRAGFRLFGRLAAR